VKTGSGPLSVIELAPRGVCRCRLLDHIGVIMIDRRVVIMMLLRFFFRTWRMW
jgi:hypothetical protein